ncbi:MAG: peptide chain release factor 2 [Firmicutes bacterium]|nr:peptide chain release factor 2 [Bacillota bacterium]
MFDLPAKEAEAEKLEAAMTQPDFWDDQAAAQQVTRDLNRLKRTIQRWQRVSDQVEDLTVLMELALEEGDEATAAEVKNGIGELASVVEQLELSSLLSGEYDENDALLAIHSGAGGTESQDWADMLMRMYIRWAEKQGHQVEVLDLMEGEEAGIKSATLQITGDYAYGYLKGEKGVHRLVRISPFDASGRRHTSFASVSVWPVLENDVEVEIDPGDLRIDTYRASGAGGQHVNKTDSAIRITHIPTGIVVQCQSERSQHANRESAMKILRARLLERQLQEQEAKMKEIQGEFDDIAWGSQIRSYVFHPYSMVKDHRTDVETGNVTAVMDGEISNFIEAYLRKK